MSLTPDQLFAAWAPADSRWSAWAKPVLFAYLPVSVPQSGPLELPSIEGFAPARETMMIIDAPEDKSVLIGLALAKIGYQPVPLYNSAIHQGMIVDMRPIAGCLVCGARNLEHIKLRPDAPPAFLLNAERMDHSDTAKIPGRFDNRWCVVPQDMPSAEYLLDAGIRNVVLIADRIRDDLKHILYRYQQAGLTLRNAADISAMAARVSVDRPRFFKSIWYRLGVFAGLRRNSAGGFGALVPDPGSGGFG